MTFSNARAALLSAVTLVAVTACSGNSSVPSVAQVAPNAAQSEANAATSPVGAGIDSLGIAPDDTTSILKKLTKDVVIGSTVDPKNGDQAGHGLSIVKATYGLKKGQLLVCNFEDKTGAAGKGTTVDVFNPTAGSKPSTLVSNAKSQGCAGVVVTSGNDVDTAGMTSGYLALYTGKGKLITKHTEGAPLVEPFSVADASNPNLYAAEYIFGSDASAGTIVNFSINYYGNTKPTAVISGFDVNKKSGWSALGPSGLAYNAKKDTLYAVDGPDNTVVAFSHASELLVKSEIVVEKGGKTFQCKFPKTTCGTLVKAGKPLNAPEAMTILPNGNLIVANTAGGNTLVEMTPTGQVLDTKVVDKSKTAGIFGLAAAGTTDSNTTLFFTDTNSNNLQELEP